MTYNFGLRLTICFDEAHLYFAVIFAGSAGNKILISPISDTDKA